MLVPKQSSGNLDRSDKITTKIDKTELAELL